MTRRPPRPIDESMALHGIDPVTDQGLLDITKLMHGNDPDCVGFDLDRALAHITTDTECLTA